MSAEALIIAPLITEKGTIVTEKANQVVFRVRPEATKDKIRLVVEDRSRSRYCGADVEFSWQENAAAAAWSGASRIGKRPT